MKKPSWVYYLSESGRPLHNMAETANSFYSEAQRLRRQADLLETEANKRWEEVEALVLKHWTPDEIAAAKMQFQHDSEQ